RLSKEVERAACCWRYKGGRLGPVVKGRAENRHELLRSKAAVVNVMVKRRELITSGMDERDERKRTSGDASKRFRRHQNWSCTTAPGRVWRGATTPPPGGAGVGGGDLLLGLLWHFRTLRN